MTGLRWCRSVGCDQHSLTLWEMTLRLLPVLCVFLALLVAGDLCAIAQDTESKPLDRVEIEPPERRAPPRPRDTGRETTRAIQPETWPQPQWNEPSIPYSSEAQFGTPIPAVTDVMGKSALSVDAGALPSQVQVINRQDIERLNVRDYTDLFRKTAGIRANMYGQGDIGHPMQIRGNSGGHGVDTLVYIDGVPQNFPAASQGGNGMADFSWLTPEMIERIEVIKGPFSVLYGNIAQAGVINIITKNSEPSPSVSMEGASFGGFRAVPILTSYAYCPTPFLLNEYMTLDGYRDNSQLKRWSSFNKITTPFRCGNLSLRFNYYESTFGSAGYIPIEDVRSGLVDRRDPQDPTNGGNHRRWETVLNYVPLDPEGRGLHLDAYVDQYVKARYSTSSGNQRLQTDDRIFCGGRLFYNYVFGEVASVMAGGEIRYDQGTANRFGTVNRQIVSTTNDYSLRLFNTAWFVQAQVKPAEKVKLIGGLRGDYFRYDIDNLLIPANSGTAFPSIVTPKFGIVLTPMENINVFANRGIGFRTPNATEFSTPTGSTNFNLQPYLTESWDIGLNASLFGNVYLAFDYYRTNMQNEVRTVAGEQVNIGNSERSGFEVEMRYFPSEAMTFFANWAWVDATVTNPTTAGQNLVTGIAENVVKTGMEFTYPLTPDILFLGDIYYEFVSGQPQYFGSSTPVYGPDYDVYNLKLTCQATNWDVFLTTRFQPREYSSDYVGRTGSQFYFNPKPFLDMSGGVKYTF